MKTLTHIAVRHPAGRRARSGRRNDRGFSLIELLTVISIIGILAAIGAGLAGVASKKSKEGATKAERDKLITAIEQYRADFNQYPPDNFVNAGAASYVNPAVNPLYYELSGTVSSQQGRYYQLADHNEQLSVAQIQTLFHRRGFLNSTEAPDKPRKGYRKDVKARQLGELGVTGVGHVDLLLAPVAWPLKSVRVDLNGDGAAEEVDLKAVAPLAGVATTDSQLRLNPWQYVSTNPTNNLTSFDLWSDVWVGRQHQIIGNFQSQ